jgi:SPP1 family predicted phage head-tail adaptor
MRAGRLDKRLWLQGPPVGRDPVTHAVSQRDEDWVPIAEVWASVESTEGSERWNSARVQYEATDVVRMRFRTVNTTMRFVYGGRKLNVVHVNDLEERHKELVVLCKEEA